MQRKLRPTIGDIAAKAGVSKGAVSFALNNRPGVSDQTRARIRQVAADLSWRPHSAARALSGSKTDVVGLVLARPARTLGVEPFFSRLISGLQAGLSAHGMALQMRIVEDTAAEIEVYRQWWNENRVDAVILVDLQEDDQRIAELDELGLPAVVIGGPARHGGVSSVWADDAEAMLSVVDYLAALGHRRIGHISGMPNFVHTRRRVEALAASAERLGLESIESLFTDFSDSQGAAITRRLLARKQRPTALIYDSDVMALAGLGVAMEMNVEVPGQLSIVAFDDSPLTQLTHPAMTALSRDTFLYGEQAASVLIRLLADPETQIDEQSQTPTLTIRASTAPPRG
ncbi:DNA-binding LacI/PurR family transcriptional regulator [Psychromicrobium silvestre]|uniref:DNA-binding LacI/PurR family transcriptional regulator n=1 Tax=Psychromicrobium silvestre TaxID=1645614 RepID=A0A7Y9LTK3_9MICC|nr:LacI family DNA-binding transcriptional regulator [Psychromicrobium silvestre]NYE95295.1 DNA-binding LacI/PurR family transcriptional regulator [Psychromicrobium silvestre]